MESLSGGRIPTRVSTKNLFFIHEAVTLSGDDSSRPVGPLSVLLSSLDRSISSSVSVAADDASQTHQQSKPLSRHQIYRMNVKGKAKFKNLSHLILNEHIKMLNEELLRMTAELKTKDEEIQMLKAENKRLKLPSSVRNL